MNKRDQLGFTILELMFTVAIAAVIVGIGIPNMQTVIWNNRTATQVNELVSALNLARSEAVAQGVDVYIIPNVGNDWTTGWRVMADSDDDRVYAEAADQTIRLFDPVRDMAFPAAPNQVVFRPTGEASDTATYVMLPDKCSTVNRQRRLTIALAGFVELARENCP